MSNNSITEGLGNFLQASPTPFHATASMVSQFEHAGFIRLDENESWQLEHNCGYFVTRNDSSLVAFWLGSETLSESGFKMMGAHTDSPCLKLKPQADIYKHGYLQLGVEVYGGALLNPWFDRDLSIAGRVSFAEKGSAEIKSRLVDFKAPVAVIPSLAIHLDREANSKRSINPQTDLPPLILQTEEGKADIRHLLLEQLKVEGEEGESLKILDFELSLYDVNPAAKVGLKQEFFASARLDNLLSCYVGMQSLLNQSGEGYKLLVCSDHEEVGSVSAAGANGPFLEAVLERIVEKLEDGSAEALRRTLNQSMMLSVDNAHGIHPNYSNKHDQKHGPLLNKGPVIKVNANQRYASNSDTAAFFKQLCEKIEVPLQSFVVRSDMGCGSTIGPIVAAELGVKTLDIGVPTFAMHSIRELAGCSDIEYLEKALTEYYRV